MPCAPISGSPYRRKPSAGNQVQRAPIANVETVPEATLLEQIPLTERRNQATAVAELENFMRGPRASGIIEFNPYYPLTPDQQDIRMLRDYELVRVPMQFGNVSTRPPSPATQPTASSTFAAKWPLRLRTGGWLGLPATKSVRLAVTSCTSTFATTLVSRRVCEFSSFAWL